ncbi:hypothetical protein Cgig2_020766 [Carnegiea gigantea]|uniref:Transcription elongation factor TFIIS n=1 Tax=Carnegiea gigantea TaxID=171969 RepID=A0A9Q1K2A2_9CARY|nr:hypothetical protein Cgig2_020766 [Carnegiea gigantea]
MSLMVGRSVECMNIHSWRGIQQQTETPEFMMLQSMIRADYKVAPKTDAFNGDSNKKRHVIRIKLKKPQQINQDHYHDPVPLAVESQKSADDQTDVKKKLVCELAVHKEKNKEGQIQKQLGGGQPLMEGELVNMVATAKRAADMVVMKRLPTTDPEFSCAVNALNALKNFSVSYDTIKSSQVVKSLELLTKHPKVKIRTEAANVLQAWKKSPAPLKVSRRSPIEKPKVGDHIQKASTMNIRKAFDIMETKVKKAEETPKQTCNIREKIREHLVEALSKVVTEANDEATKAKAKACAQHGIAALIESTMYKKLGQSHSNMAKQRSILFNLTDPNNPELRRQVLVGEIRPENLVEMTAEEMASNKRKRENEEIRLKSLIRSEAIEQEEGTTEQFKGTTEQFKCGRCGQRKCTYYQLQTRSADEPMTTFVRCVVCYNRWKF